MNKKKIISLTLASLLIVSTAPMTAEAYSENDSINVKINITNEEKQELHEEISVVLNNYFNWHYKNLKGSDKNANEIKKIVDNIDLINFKKTKLEWMDKWYKSINEGINDYSIYIDINEIKVHSEYIYVKANYGEDLINETSSDVVQKIRNQEHKLVLKNTSNNIMIINDYYQDELAEEFFSVEDNDFTVVNEKVSKNLKNASNNYQKYIKNIDKLSKEHKSNLKQANYLSKLESISSRAYSSYDGAKARNYAAKYALSYNSNYSNYNGRGGDCTNFVSQCIYAGGIPTDATWKKNSNAWIRVTELRNWLVKKRYAKEFTWQSNAKEGDLVQLYNSSNGWYHSLIITYKRTDGQLFVSSHSADYYNRALANYTSKMRYLILTS